MKALRKSVGRAQRLRRRMTPPEVRLWVRFRRLPDLKVRRQHPWGAYILDFFCEEASLCIEVDGAHSHDWSRADHDATRTALLTANGIEVVRVAAVDVMRDPDGIAEVLIAALRERVDVRRQARG